MNIEAFALRLYREGHRPSDFAGLREGMAIVEKVIPPEMVTPVTADGKGIYAPEAARDIAVQYALAHKVVALPAGCEEKIGGVVLEVGMVVKCREAHLDPIDASKRYCSIPLRHILSRLNPEA